MRCLNIPYIYGVMVASSVVMIGDAFYLHKRTNLKKPGTNYPVICFSDKNMYICMNCLP